MPQPTEYFTGTDASIYLLTHPDEEWRGQEVDCAYFRLTAGTSPIHIWNYARRSGTPAMANPAQEERLGELQAGTAGGAPFDDTAESNMQVSLQLLINEERFENTYYQFRSMSEIGDLKIKYDTQVSFEDRAEAGYKLLDGRVSTVSRENTTRAGTYPSVEITFRDARPVGQNLVIDTSEFAPSGRQRGGPGVSRALQGEGLGRDRGEPAFVARFYEGMVGGKKAQTALENIPSTLDAFDQISYAAREEPVGIPSGWAPNQKFIDPIMVTESRKEGRAVWLWTQGGDKPHYKEITPTETAYQTIKSKLPDN